MKLKVVFDLDFMTVELPKSRTEGHADLHLHCGGHPGALVLNGLSWVALEGQNGGKVSHLSHLCRTLRPVAPLTCKGFAIKPTN